MNTSRGTIAAFGMLNNPQYRQEPWRESIASRLQCFDAVVLVCGHEPDLATLAAAFPDAWKSGKLAAIYKPWPFPEWSYEELPRHLNAALSLARAQGCDWIVKLDIDTVFHERDMALLRRLLAKADRKKKWAISVRKLQFFTPRRYFKKASIPIILRVDAPIAYGVDDARYTDLCQPIVWDGESNASYNGVSYDIPLGKTIPKERVLKSRKLVVFNYDYTFRTYERSIELLFQIEMAHARFWGRGYSGLAPEAITRETAMRDFLALAKRRARAMRRRMRIERHPTSFQEALRSLDSAMWGYNLWGRV